MERSNDNHITNASRFSWRRVKEVACFYRPGIERQVLWYLIISVIFSIVTLLPLNSYAQMGFYSIIWTAIPLMFELAPCMLTKWGDTRIIERLIPASPAEKYTFRLLYFLVVIPIVGQLLPRLANYLYLQMPAVQDDSMLQILEAGYQSAPIIWVVNILSASACTLTCLYVVTRARTNRTLKGVLSVFGVQIGYGILGAIWGFTSAFRIGLQDGLAGKVQAESELSRSVINDMVSSPYMYVVGGIIGAYVILMLVLNYRILYKRNL